MTINEAKEIIAFVLQSKAVGWTDEDMAYVIANKYSLKQKGEG